MTTHDIKDKTTDAYLLWQDANDKATWTRGTRFQWQHPTEAWHRIEAFTDETQALQQIKDWHRHGLSITVVLGDKQRKFIHHVGDLGLDTVAVTSYDDNPMMLQHLLCNPEPWVETELEQPTFNSEPLRQVASSIMTPYKSALRDWLESLPPEHRDNLVQLKTNTPTVQNLLDKMFDFLNGITFAIASPLRPPMPEFDNALAQSTEPESELIAEHKQHNEELLITFQWYGVPGKNDLAELFVSIETLQPNCQGKSIQVKWHPYNPSRPEHLGDIVLFEDPLYDDGRCSGQLHMQWNFNDRDNGEIQLR